MISSRSVLSTIGLILSMYAVYVEHKQEQLSHSDNSNNEDVEPFVSLCDIEAIGASCSKVFALPEGKLFSYFGIVPSGHFLDVPNAVLGCIFYTIQLILVETMQLVPSHLNAIITTCAMSSSVFLAYQLTFVVHDLCVLCWSTHIINTTLFYQNVLSPFIFKKTTTGDHQKKKSI